MAHALGVEVRLKDGTIYVEAFFHDDSPAKNAPLTFENELGSKVFSGNTNKEGKLQLPAFPPGKYKLIVDDGTGHRASTLIVIPETSPNADSTNQLISTNSTREKFTQVPWINIFIGLFVIAFLGIVGNWLNKKATRVSKAKE